VHLEVERRLAARTLVLYRDAFAKLQAFATDQGVALRDAQVHHVRRWAAALHREGLGPRSIAARRLAFATLGVAAVGRRSTANK